MLVGMIFIAGCGGSGTPEGGEVVVEEESNWNEEVASEANELCAAHDGVQQIVPFYEEGWTEGIEVVVCVDGIVQPWR